MPLQTASLPTLALVKFKKQRIGMIYLVRESTTCIPVYMHDSYTVDENRMKDEVPHILLAVSVIIILLVVDTVVVVGVVQGACELAVAVGATDWNALQRNFDSIRVATQEAFDTAAQEPKVTNRDMLVASNSSPLQQQQQQQQQQAATSSSDSSTGSSNNGFGKSKREGEIDLVSAADTQVISNPMRKLMTGVFEEALAGQTAAGNAVVYVGEDVRHGG